MHGVLGLPYSLGQSVIQSVDWCHVRAGLHLTLSQSMTCVLLEIQHCVVGTSLGFIMPFLAANLQPPYVAVVFSSIRHPDAADGYETTSRRMEHLVAQQPGFLGVESTGHTGELRGMHDPWRMRMITRS